MTLICSYFIQTEEPEVEGVKDPARDQCVKEIDGRMRDEEPHEEQSESVGPEEKHGSGESKTTTDDAEFDGKSEPKSGEGGEDGKLQAVEDGGPESEGETLKKAKRAEMTKPEDQKKEDISDADDVTFRGANIKTQTKEVEAKEKAKSGDAGKKVKPKKKAGPPSSSVPRPRPSARSIRAAARNDIIAKFQQGAPE